jgi:polysaccharide biosynthesis protein PelA
MRLRVIQANQPDTTPDTALATNGAALDASRDLGYVHASSHRYNPSVRKSLRNARSYACYYGDGSLDALERFEVVVLQPRSYARADLERLKAAKVVTLAYISIGEESLDHIEAFEDIESFAWTKRDAHGALQRNPDWGSLIVNASHPLWRARVLERAKNALAQGFAGFFLDVLDAQNSADQRALAKLVRDVRVSAPAAPIMINRGFRVLEVVQDAVDAVMFESLSCTWRLLGGGLEHYEPVSSAALKANLEIVRGINAIAERWEIGRFALDYTDTPELEAHARTTAESLGFVPFTSNRLLTRI